MEIGVLGPLRVTVDGHPVSLPAKQQTLLAILAFQPNRTVSTDRLIEALWGEDASPTAIRTLQSHVFQLRRLVAPDPDVSQPGPTIVTDGRGYRLAVDPLAIDSRRFERLLEQGRAESAADPQTGLGLLREALALWRGPALADVGDEPIATAEIERLVELRGAAFDELVQIRLGLADYDGVIPELRREVSESPFREQLWASLMVAYVRAGRKAEALLAYREAVAAMRRELDAEPSRELQDLAGRIRDGKPLDSAGSPAAGAHDVAHSSAAGMAPIGAGLAIGAEQPAGAPDTSSPVRVPDGARGRTRILRRPASMVAILSVILVAGLVVAQSLPAATRPTPSTPTPNTPVVSLTTDSVGRLDRRGTLTASVRVGAQPDAIAFGAGSAWVSDAAEDAVTRVDAAASTAIQRIPVGTSPAGIAFGFGSVWVANSGDRTVSRIDPTTNEVVARIGVGTAPAGIATDDRWVWVTNRLDHTMTRIDPNDGSTTTFVVGATPLGVATAAHSVWVADADSSLVLQIDAQTGVVQHEIPVGSGPSAVAATANGDAVWVVNTGSGTVFRIDTASSTVTAAQSVGAGPTGIGVGVDGVWVAVPSTAEIVQLDSRSAQVIGRYPVGASPRSVAVDADGPMFTARSVEGSHRGGTLIVASRAQVFPTTIDPTYGFDADLALSTHDALVAFKQVGGPDGLTLVPDLAASIPSPTDAGRTWTFQLRTGLTYSNGAPVRAGDVLGSIERAAMAGDSGGGLHGNTDIIGSNACGAKPPCDLARGITVDDEAGTVTFHLVAPDPRFPSALATAFIVPAGTPLTESGAPIPGTGPYVVDRFEAGQNLHLVRNPTFHQWSKDARPDGYPDAIDWTVSDRADPSSLVEAGLADVVLFDSTLSAERLARLRERVPAQLHIAPSQMTWFEMMNTRIPPFDKLEVRQAINYAADRDAIVNAWGGPLAGRVTCQAIPPEYSGYEATCPYTVLPSANGRWLGPDMDRAKALIERAGVKGMPVTVWAWDDGGQHVAVARYFTDLLNRLGFKATTRLLELQPYFDLIEHSPDKVQMAGFWFLSSSRSGSDTILGVFTCPDFPTSAGYSGQPSEFCSPAVDADVKRALGEADPLAANRLWARIDAEVVDAAPAVAAFNPTDVIFLSQRVGNYAHNPQYDILLDQLWVQ